jgi:hypothetical protein
LRAAAALASSTCATEPSRLERLDAQMSHGAGGTSDRGVAQRWDGMAFGFGLRSMQVSDLCGR